MMELTISGKVYQFNFGMGFMREMNKRVTAKPDSNSNATKNIGLQYAVAGIMDNDLEDLVDCLEAANKGFQPRVTRDMLDSHIDNPETDVDALFAAVLDFLRNANATKKTVAALEKAIQENQNQNK